MFHQEIGENRENKENKERAEEELLRDVLKNPRVRQMGQYVQHGKVSTLEHCENVARLSCRINRAFHLHGDERALVRGGMLHDFYLYDWHKWDGGTHALHGFQHPERAAKNAIRYFQISEKERQIIRCHMWPLTITKLPKCREAWIVCLADKCCAVAETVRRK